MKDGAPCAVDVHAVTTRCGHLVIGVTIEWVEGSECKRGARQ
jgi:hypothetical protein